MMRDRCSQYQSTLNTIENRTSGSTNEHHVWKTCRGWNQEILQRNIMMKGIIGANTVNGGNRGCQVANIVVVN